MYAQTFKTVIQAKQLQPILNLPDALARQSVEVIIRPVPKKVFENKDCKEDYNAHKHTQMVSNTWDIR